MPPPEEHDKPRGDKVDLNDLEWEDRERVLRLLFSKMNAGVQPTQLLQKVGARKMAQRQEEMKQISEFGIYMQNEQGQDSGMYGAPDSDAYQA